MTTTATTTSSASSPATTSPSTDRALLAAGIGASLTTVLHIFGGGIEIARPLIESSLDEVPRLVMFAVWHMTSVALALSAGALLLGSRQRYRQQTRFLTIFIGLMWVGFGLCFFGVAMSQPGGDLINDMNQWILLLPPGLLALWGARSSRQNAR